MNGWKVADVSGLALVGAVFGVFTFFMGRSILEDGLMISAGASFEMIVFASALLHVTIALAAMTLGALIAAVYRAVI